MKKLSWTKGLCALAVVLGLGGCGSDDGDPNCGKIAACGGDIVGDWKITDTCFSLNASALTDSFCPTATLDAGGLKATGNVSYEEDLTYSGMLTLSGSLAIVLPPSCLMFEGIPLTCSQVELVVKQELGTGSDSPIKSVKCTGS